MEAAKEDTEGNHHLVIVNVSPITYGHTLLVPSARSCLPQVSSMQRYSNVAFEC